MKEDILKCDSSKEFYSKDERCWITELYNTPSDDKVSIAQARVEPGVTTAKHFLEGIDERYVIVSGEGEVEVGTLPPTQVAQGDVAAIPAGTSQRIKNTGKTDLIFYCICTPRFYPNSYHDIDK
jgi:mannose-6-phosphate isomerase-like protein (cupin superfamily)